MCNEDNNKMASNINLVYSMEKLTLPAVLVLLSKKQAHGYEIIQELNHLDYINGELEAATVYRTLRRMERDGLISSSWQHGEFGPARRQYQLTDEGRKSLDDWVIVLKTRVKQIEALISHYHEIKS